MRILITYPYTTVALWSFEKFVVPSWITLWIIFRINASHLTTVNWICDTKPAQLVDYWAFFYKMKYNFTRKHMYVRFCFISFDYFSGLQVCFYVPENSWCLMNLPSQNLIHATRFLCPQGASYQSWAHGCPLTQNTSLSAAACFLLTAHNTSWAQGCIGYKRDTNTADKSKSFS